MFHAQPLSHQAEAFSCLLWKPTVNTCLVYSVEGRVRHMSLLEKKKAHGCEKSRYVSTSWKLGAPCYRILATSNMQNDLTHEIILHFRSAKPFFSSLVSKDSVYWQSVAGTYLFFFYYYCKPFSLGYYVSSIKTCEAELFNWVDEDWPNGISRPRTHWVESSSVRSSWLVSWYLFNCYF